MTTMARESRKWNLSIGLYTQSIDDIPKIITDELATTVVILGSGTEKSIENLAERFGLTESQVKSRLHRTRQKLKLALEKEGIAV